MYLFTKLDTLRFCLTANICLRVELYIGYSLLVERLPPISDMLLERYVNQHKTWKHNGFMTLSCHVRQGISFDECKIKHINDHVHFWAYSDIIQNKYITFLWFIKTNTTIEDPPVIIGFITLLSHYLCQIRYFLCRKKQYNWTVA